MKVVQVVASVNAGVGGPAESVPALSAALAQCGVDVRLATLDYTSLGVPTVPSGYVVERVPAGVLTRLTRGCNPVFRRRLERMATDGASLIHSHGLWMFPNAYARMAAARARVPLVVSPRGMLQTWALGRSRVRKWFAWRLFEWRNLADASMFHATSEQEVEAIRAAGFRQPVACIPNGVTIPNGPPMARGILEAGYPELRNRRWLLYLSRLHPVKGLPTLLQAWRELQARYPRWQLIVAGDALDGYRDEVRKMAGEYGIGARTTFTGPLSGPLKSCALAHSELFVLPSLSESFGIAIAEALAHGVAVITTRGAPWPELEERRCGWWIDHGSGPLRAALAQALEQSPDELREMGERGRELVLERYCWRELGGQMKSAYEWLAGSAQAPGCIRKFSASAPMGATAQGP